MPVNSSTSKNLYFLSGGGEMGELIRSYDWSQTSLNTPDKWPKALCTTLGIVLHSAFPMFLFWGDDLVCFYNDAFRPSLGENGKHSAIGKKGTEVWADIWDIIGPLLKQVMNTGEPVWFEDRLVPFYRNGHTEDIYWTFSYSPAYGDKGGINGVLVTCTETTEKVLSVQQMKQSRTELLTIQKRLEAELEAGKRMQRQKDDFIGIASHELKTPLTTLSAILQVLELKVKNGPDPFLLGAIDKANNQVKKMSSMINGFLNISRLESGKIMIEKEKFNLNQLLRDMIEEIQLTAPGHSIRFITCPIYEIYADREKIGSVVSNLLSNAVKYSPKGKNIEVRCELTNGGAFAHISIKDEGMGVKEHDLERLFDRYYRVESQHTKYITGFGIGLYLSAGIVKEHGGQIWLESKSGVGSTFHFTLPIDGQSTADR
ncbi:MAG: ATP-binding protein [Mucilaginibacter sp.]